METLSIEINVFCEECGNLLKTNSNTDSLYVEPCAVCLDSAYTEGFNEGEQEGQY